MVTQAFDIASTTLRSPGKTRVDAKKALLGRQSRRGQTRSRLDFMWTGA